MAQNGVSVQVKPHPYRQGMWVQFVEYLCSMEEAMVSAAVHLSPAFRRWNQEKQKFMVILFDYTVNLRPA